MQTVTVEKQMQAVIRILSLVAALALLGAK